MHLSDAAAALIAERDGKPGHVFSVIGGNAPPSPMGMWAKIVAAGGPTGKGLGWHRLRNSARTILSHVGVRPVDAEMLLGHSQGSLARTQLSLLKSAPPPRR